MWMRMGMVNQVVVVGPCRATNKQNQRVTQLSARGPSSDCDRAFTQLPPTKPTSEGRLPPNAPSCVVSLAKLA